MQTDVAVLALALEPAGMPPSADKRWAGRQAIQLCLLILFISVLMVRTSKTWLLLVLLLMPL